MRIIRIGLFAFAFWVIGIGILAFVASLSDPVPELAPIAALMSVVLGLLLLLALWAFPRAGRRGRAYGGDDD